MRNGQPIWWKDESNSGEPRVGIVADVLPLKAGVLAYLPGSKKKIKVTKPHKIVVPQAIAQVFEHFKGYPEVAEWLNWNTEDPAPKRRRARIDLEPHYTSVYEAALAEIEQMPAEEWLLVTGFDPTA